MSLFFQEINLALSEMYLQEEPIIFELPKKRVVSSTEMEQCWCVAGIETFFNRPTISDVHNLIVYTCLTSIQLILLPS